MTGRRLQQLIAAADPRVSYNSTKGKHLSRALFDLSEADAPGSAGHRPRREVAISRAKAVADRWEFQGTAPAARESTTEMYRLVQVLQRHLPVSRSWAG